jgi:hypothetical protein
MDGVGSLIGIPPGGNRGSIKSILPEIEKISAKDGVHYESTGYENLCTAITTAISEMQNGSLTKLRGIKPEISRAAADGAGGGLRRKEVFFWRGFSSPVGASYAARPPMELESGTPPLEQNLGGRFRGGGRHRGGGPGRGFYHHADQHQDQHQGNSSEANNTTSGSYRGGPMRMKKYPYHRYKSPY